MCCLSLELPHILKILNLFLTDLFESLMHGCIKILHPMGAKKAEMRLAQNLHFN